MTKKFKKVLTIAAPTLLLLASCDTKTCKCYIYNGNNNPYIEQEYVSEGTLARRSTTTTAHNTEPVWNTTNPTSTQTISDKSTRNRVKIKSLLFYIADPNDS